MDCPAQNAALPFVLSACIAVNIYGVVLYARFLARLRVAHRAEWVRLGSPTWLEEEYKFHGVGWIAYFKGRMYESLGDRILTAQGNKVRTCMLAGVLAAILTIANLATFKGEDLLQGTLACWR